MSSSRRSGPHPREDTYPACRLSIHLAATGVERALSTPDLREGHTASHSAKEVNPGVDDQRHGPGRPHQLGDGPRDGGEGAEAEMGAGPQASQRLLGRVSRGTGHSAAEEPQLLSQKGGATTSYAIWYAVKKYAQLAGVGDVSPHSLRHTVAARLVRDPEVDLVTAATFLGHSRLDTTARYSRPTEEALAEAGDRLV